MSGIDPRCTCGLGATKGEHAVTCFLRSEQYRAAVARGRTPWLETWDLESIDREPEEQYQRFARVAVHMGEDRFVGGINISVHDEGEARARLAAAAPALVRALLSVEWMTTEDGWVKCGSCGSPGEGEPHCYGSPEGAVCIVDAALTAAGLPDQASRRVAREKMR